MATQQRFLRILRLFYQGLRLITAGLGKEIKLLEDEIKTSDQSQS